MIKVCPGCKGPVIKKGDGKHICNRCGAQEVDGNIWRLQSGRLVAAPDMEKTQLEKAKQEWPSGDWENINH